MQNAFSDPENAEIFNKTKDKFPNLKNFKKYFYRFIDTTTNVEFVEIEEKMFSTVVKSEVEKEFAATFSSNREMNKSADQRCASIVHNSLKLYEKNLRKGERSYFKF